MKEGGTAVAFRLPINFGFVPAAWIQQESTSVFMTGHNADKISQACKFLGIICTQATSGKELAKMHEKEAPTGSSKQNTAGLRTGQSYGGGRECIGHRLGFHL